MGAVTDAIDTLGDWLAAHDRGVELTAIWILVAAFSVYALVKVASWAAIYHQPDRTPVGRALRIQKLAEAVMGAGLATLYALTLWAYYQHHVYGVWTRLVVRSLVVAGVVAASVFGVRFTLALRREMRRDAGDGAEGVS